MKSSMSSATYRRLKSVTIGNVGLNSLERGHGQCGFNPCRSPSGARGGALSIFQAGPPNRYFSTTAADGETDESVSVHVAH